MATTVKELEEERDLLQASLIGVQYIVNGWVPANLDEIEVDIQLHKLNTLDQQIQDLYLLMGKQCKREKIDFYKDHVPTFQVITAGIDGTQLKSLKLKRAIVLAKKATPVTSTFKLERIKIPTFTGDLSEWQGFHDIFSSSVDLNVTMAPVEKLIHLKSYLSGEAAKSIAAYAMTDANYKEAFDTLKARYSNTREIIFSHIQKFDEFVPFSKESTTNLRALSNALNQSVRSLTSMAVPVEHWDVILVYMALKKMDHLSKKEYLLMLDNNLPNLKQFVDFLETRARALVSTVVKSNPDTEKKRYGSHHVSPAAALPACVLCEQDHGLYYCSKFKAMKPMERRSCVQQQRLCFNCLRKGHAAKDCKAKYTCSTCKAKHNSLLHVDKPQQQVPVSNPSTKMDKPQNMTSSHCASMDAPVVLLSTMVVNVEDSSGFKRSCRVFLDPGSEVNFISSSCVERLGLPCKSSRITIKGIGGLAGERVKGVVTCTLYSKLNNFKMDISALVYQKLTANHLPRESCQEMWPHTEGLQLSDPNFHKPGRVDILLGANVLDQIMLPGLLRGPVHTPLAQNTQFGWILTGPVSKNSETESCSHAALVADDTSILKALDATLQKFWELEESDASLHTSLEEDEKCEAHFMATHKRHSTGAYIVELPFIENAAQLGESRKHAVSRWQRVENRLQRTPHIQIEYVKWMKEYLAAGFFEKIPDGELMKDSAQCYYLPHREVVKESSVTTKVRVVYDASAKSANGVSLNDVLMTGPKLQTDLVELLIRFRSHIVAFTADITRFFLQSHVASYHADYQRFVWRESPDHPLEDYRLLRVTFGLTTSPYLAMRCLQQLAEDEKEVSIPASIAIREDFLVDNVLTGAPDVTTALQLQADILTIMGRGNLKLRTWNSNRRELLESLPLDYRATQSELLIEDPGAVQKTIGILWNPSLDTFGICVSVPDMMSGITKRKVLSSIAKVFDPLGWVTPVSVRPKLLMQELWKSKLEWDDEIPLPLQKLWKRYCRELPELKRFQLDRCITRPNHDDISTNVKYELHAFSDASNVAYAACIYLRTITDNGSNINLIMAKSKVAPLKVETMPRLELCGAVLASRLINIVKRALKLQFSVVHGWTDSTIVLGWLSSSEKLPVFQANRVRKIQAVLPGQHWSHVSGEDNPADAASRGISVTSLLQHTLWKSGPTWLKTISFPDDLTAAMVTVTENWILDVVDKNSSFPKIRRIFGYVLRFINNCKTSVDKVTGPLTTKDLDAGLMVAVRAVQQASFGDTIRNCQQNSVDKTKLKFLAPFLDENGILRVGGRLGLSSTKWDKKHPILLPQRGNFTESVMRHLHLTHLHAGPQLLLAITRQQFWIVRGLDVAKRIYRHCVICHRQNPATSQQLMGQLPFQRVTPSNPFAECGVDYAGPFTLCLRPGRHPIIIKSYVAVFICMATRAVHLELVGDLTTAAFIAALHRFVSRRGLPTNIYSDGGKNFVGAAAELKEFQRLVDSQKFNNDITSFLAEKGVQFHFNPPLAPHHGGLWEAGVKSMKKHLKRVVQDRKLSIEEFETLLTQVEACLNSRPICAMSSNPMDCEVLTPAHFLVGTSLKKLPDPDLTDINSYRLNRWQFVQQMQQHFWKRWSLEYLSTLQARPKWFTPAPDLQIGMLVLIRDDNPSFGTLKWTLGRIQQTYPGPDGKIRVCDVRVGNGSVYKRPIVKLSPLPIYE